MEEIKETKDNISEEELIKTWIGEKQEIMYPKMNQSGSCSGWTLLFGIYYLIYRKMYLVALIAWLIDMVIVYMGNPIASIAKWIVYGFTFYPVYKWDIKRKINSYRYQNHTEEEIKEYVKQQGGTSATAVAIVAAITAVVLIGCILLFGMAMIVLFKEIVSTDEAGNIINNIYTNNI